MRTGCKLLFTSNTNISMQFVATFSLRWKFKLIFISVSLLCPKFPCKGHPCFGFFWVLRMKNAMDFGTAPQRASLEMINLRNS